MLITNKAQYACHKTFIWQRVSLTCCTCVLGGGRTVIFSFDKSTSLEGGSEKKPRDDQRGGGGFQKRKGKNKETIIAHPLDKL